MSTGMPAGIWLAKFGVIVHDYFGHVPYHVGSSLKTKDWRDVDVRLILPDEEFERRFGKIQNTANVKLAAVTLAFAALGKEMTGLPIDFQIQPQSHANKVYGGEMRSALIEVDPELEGGGATVAKCIGILGSLFGHKFIKVVGGELVYRSNYCWRCGSKRIQEAPGDR